MPPKFSLITPVYNAESYLEGLIEDVLNQEFDSYEFILIDDGSTDKSLDVLKKYSSNPKIKVFHLNHIGAGNARNKGIIEAKGDYIWFVDADDRIAENCLVKLNKSLSKKRPTSAVFTFKDVNSIENFTKYSWDSRDKQGIRKEVPEGRIKGSDALKFIFEKKINPSPWNKLFHKSLFNSPEMRFESKIHHQDLGLIPMLLGQSEEVLIIKEDLYHYHRRDQSITYSVDYKHSYSVFRALEQVYYYLISIGYWESMANLYHFFAWNTINYNFNLRKNSFSEEMQKKFVYEFLSFSSTVGSLVNDSILDKKSHDLAIKCCQSIFEHNQKMLPSLNKTLIQNSAIFYKLFYKKEKRLSLQAIISVLRK